jgi:hypothetical protein
MEDFDATRVETFDELVTKHTRRELEELAQKLGVENLGVTKSQLADAILGASKKQKELPKTIPASPKEAPMVEKPKSAVKSVVRGTKGVMAKSVAIDSKAAELQKAGREIREDGIRRMNKGVKEFHAACDEVAREMQSDGQKMMEDGRQRFELGQSEFKRSLDAQIKENHDVVARMQASQEEMSRSFQKAGKDIRDSGYRNLQKGLNEFQGIVNFQVKENQKAVVKLNSGARELQGRAASFNSEIHRYQEQDLKNYVRDFYYG